MTWSTQPVGVFFERLAALKCRLASGLGPVFAALVGCEVCKTHRALSFIGAAANNPPAW